jgi:hypothetical protein
MTQRLIVAYLSLKGVSAREIHDNIVATFVPDAVSNVNTVVIILIIVSIFHSNHRTFVSVTSHYQDPSSMGATSQKGRHVRNM